MKMTVARLIEDLGMFDPDAEVRLAFQPNWPFEHSIGRVEEAYNEDDPDASAVVYVAEGSQLGYLPGFARDVIGW